MLCNHGDHRFKDKTGNAFFIRPAALEDAPTIARIAEAACANDRNNLVKSRGSSDHNHENGVRDAVASWIQKPARCCVLKAVDEKSNEIAGWICWAFVKDDRIPTSNEGVDVSEEASPDHQEDTQHVEHKASAAIKNMNPEDRIKAMESFTSSDLARWQEKLCPPGAQCGFIIAIGVSPTYQSRGIGSELIRQGTQKADIERFYCWVHASDGGHKAFAKEGFNVIGSLTVNLDEYASEPRIDETGTKQNWGKYVFRYMRREYRS